MWPLLALFLLFQSAGPLEEGAKALDANQPQTAEPLFRQAIQADPQNYLAHFDLALALAMQAKDPEAIAELRRTLELKTGLYEAEINLGMLLLRDRRAADALPVLRQALEAKPAEVRPNGLYAEAQLETGHLDEAEKYFRAANDQAGLGRVTAERLRQAEAAKQAAIEAQAARDKPFNDLMDRGRQLRDEHKYPEAAREFLAAAQLRPESVTAWREIAAAYVISKNFAPGLAALDRLKALGDETPGDLYFRAISLDALHQLKPALESYRRFLAAADGRFPDDEFRARQRARIIEDELKRK